MQYDESIEFQIWHNGRAVTPLIYFSTRITRGYENSFTLPSLGGGPGYTIRMRFNGEVVDNWVSCEMWIFDEQNMPISTPRPALILLAPCDIPMTTVFPAAGDRPISHAGIWVVTTRLARTMHDLKAAHGVPVEK